jgi:A/G-specific adenine glycosylase
VESRQVQAALWTTATTLADGPRPGALNQALMELGATLCTKHAPGCERCPVAQHCSARAQGRVDELPRARVRKKPVPTPLVAIFSSSSRGAIHLMRGDEGTFAGLWNLPMAEGRGRAAARALCEASGLSRAASLARTPAARIEHVLSHRHLKVELWLLRGVRPSPGSALRAVMPRELDALGVSQLTRKAIAAVEGAR